MRIGTITFVVAVLTALLSGRSEARIVHNHHSCGYGPYYDYSHSNALSPYSYIYPAANWGRFFQCRMFYSPVYVYRDELF